MNDAAGMHVLDRAENLSRVVRGYWAGEAAVALDAFEQFAVVGEFEHKVERAFVVERPEESDDAGMSLESVEGVFLDGHVLLLLFLWMDMCQRMHTLFLIETRGP